MTFKKYQKFSLTTAVYPLKGKNYIYPLLGLVGESGEMAEKIKKIIRDNNGKISKAKRKDLMLEAGDVLWYLSILCYELKIDFDEVAVLNQSKLTDRKRRRHLHGSGDYR